MYFDPFAREAAQQRLQEQMREAQECHASQRRQMQQLGLLLNWAGKRFIVWGEKLQLRQQRLEPLNRRG